jgi:hypothetical protein
MKEMNTTFCSFPQKTHRFAPAITASTSSFSAEQILFLLRGTQAESLRKQGKTLSEMYIFKI